MAKYKLFDFLNDLNHQKKNLLREDIHAEKEYSPWIVNVGMSLHPDTILYANDMNEYYHISKAMQYDFYIHGVRSRKRFAKWPKQLAVHKDADTIKKVFNINIKRACEYIELMDPKVIKDIVKKHNNVGGIKK